MRNVNNRIMPLYCNWKGDAGLQRINNKSWKKETFIQFAITIQLFLIVQCAKITRLFIVSFLFHIIFLLLRNFLAVYKKFRRISTAIAQRKTWTLFFSFSYSSFYTYVHAYRVHTNVHTYTRAISAILIMYVCVCVYLFIYLYVCIYFYTFVSSLYSTAAWNPNRDFERENIIDNALFHSNFCLLEILGWLRYYVLAYEMLKILSLIISLENSLIDFQLHTQRFNSSIYSNLYSWFLRLLHLWCFLDDFLQFQGSLYSMTKSYFFLVNNYWNSNLLDISTNRFECTRQFSEIRYNNPKHV